MYYTGFDLYRWRKQWAFLVPCNWMESSLIVSFGMCLCLVLQEMVKLPWHFKHWKIWKKKGLKSNANSWNGIISGCIENGFFEDALDVLQDMLCFPEVPYSITVTNILLACARLKDLDLGGAVHGYAIRRGHGGNYHVEG